MSIVDSFGRQMTFAWFPFRVTDLNPPPSNALPYPMAIKEITLPDGTKLRYSYDPAPTATGPTPARAERLVKVERLDAANIVVDSTTYLYEDARFRTHLTGWIDHKGVRMGTYAYDTGSG